MGLVVGTLRSGAVVGAMICVASGTDENLGDLRSGTAVGAFVGRYTFAGRADVSRATWL